MESTGPQSGENRILKVGHPRLHLNPIMPFEPAPEPQFLKFSTPPCLMAFTCRGLLEGWEACVRTATNPVCVEKAAKQPAHFVVRYA